jgi:prepilin peptidase CpaA
MGAVGGLLGPRSVLAAVIVTFLVGGVYAIILLVWHGYLRVTAKRYWANLKSFIYTKDFIYVPPSENEKKPKLCYGVAIALGTFISVILKIRF